MTYVLSKSEVGICMSIFLNETISYQNCLEKVDDLSNAYSEAIYCCSMPNSLFHHFEYCCSYQALVSQHSISLFFLFLLTVAACLVFSLSFLLNLYMTVMAASSSSTIPNINTLQFLPKPNFFPNPTDSIVRRKRSKSKRSKSKQKSTPSNSKTKSKTKSPDQKKSKSKDGKRTTSPRSRQVKGTRET